MELGLTGRRVLVTGATAGIGRAVATAFAAEGARVAVTYRHSAEQAAELTDELGGADGRALAVRYALDEADSPEAAVRTVEEAWGGVDVIVANAVRRMPRRAPGEPAEQVDSAVWRPFVHDNLVQPMATVLSAVGGMRERGWGRIVLLSSHVVRDGRRGQEFYAAAKSGLHGFCRSLAHDVGSDGILVNVVCPGLTRTDGVLANLPATVREEERTATATDRLSTPAEVAATTVFLGSAANGNLTGEVITVAGGR
jgi:3-oxoacyl-[acyl-carrier protein] reductase